MNEQLQKNQGDLSGQFKQLREEFNRTSDNTEDIENLRAKIKYEILLKQTTINKLHEVVYRKDLKETTDKVSNTDLWRKDKDLEKLQQELSQENINTMQLSEEVASNHSL